MKTRNRFNGFSGERMTPLIRFVDELWIYQVVWEIPEELRAE
jgi:hypothetical protein